MSRTRFRRRRWPLGSYGFIAHYGGDTNYTSSDGVCEPFTVITPSILIVKTTSTPVVVSGGTATFGITVSNPSNVTLTNVNVTDAIAPGCARTAAQIALIAPHLSSTFAPGDSVTYTCTQANVTANETNSATATGTPPVGPNVTSTSTVDVTVDHPAIKIVKTTTTPTLPSGGTASFGITVTNTGDVTLTNVNVTDAIAPGCARTAAQIALIAPHLSSTFAPGDSVTYTCTQANVTANETNTAITTGTPPLGPNVTDSSSVPVAIVVTGTSNFTPGYWKNHSKATTPLLPIMLGNFTVSDFDTASEIMSEMGCGSQGVENCMAGMLLATLLNLKQGGAVLPCITAAVAQAQALLGSGPGGYNYSGPHSTPLNLSAADKATMMSLHDTLSNYSQDGVATHC